MRLSRSYLWSPIVGIAIGMLALWIGAAPVMGSGNTTVGGSNPPGFRAAFNGVGWFWYGCQDGGPSQCANCAGTIATSCYGNLTHTDCVGGPMTVISASVGQGHVISGAKAYCTGSINGCSDLYNASCTF